MFEPSEVEANASVTVSLTVDVGADTDVHVVSIPEAFTIFACRAPSGWTCSASALGALPEAATVRRDGSTDTTVTIELDLRTPTAGGEYPFGDVDVLTVTGGFEGGPTTASERDDATGTLIAGAEAPPGGDAGSSDALPSLIAALLLVGVAVATYRTWQRAHG